MALDLFSTDPDAAPKAKPDTDYDYGVDFQFRAGRQVNKRPVSLKNWRVTVSKQETGDAIAQLLGGTAEEWETSKDDHIQVLTETSSVEIVINGADGIEDKLIMWPAGGGQPIHECDGQFSLMADDLGQPCGCPPLLSDKKRAHKRKTGPGPNITVNFRLAHDYDLGKGKFVSGAWTLATVIHEVKQKLDQIPGEALCRLILEPNEFVNEDGETIKFKKPVIEVLGSYNDAIAEER
jgi:hypothetical protein